jgi:oligopeptide/dipeptide ABC transporter ATP-binding protein
MALLEVRDLRTYFNTDKGTARSVDGVSFTLDKGEVLGIVGESGCGKSVTSLSIMRLVPQPPGHIMPGSSIRFRDEEIVAAPEKRMREIRGNDIAMIFQEPMTSLNPVFPIGEQIAEALRLHRGMSKAKARAAAIDMLRLVGIPDPDARVDHYPHQLSGGQRQRVMIAIALSCEPDLLIADEPTTALDVTIQAQILELLADLRNRLGMAIMLITHDLGVVAEVCDRVVVMYAGQVVEEGPVAEIFRNPRHPYTQGLMQAIPRLGRRAERLAVIPGMVPAAINWPIGCRFHARCPYGFDVCVNEQPGLFAINTQHTSRCWLEKYPARREEVDRAGGYATVRDRGEEPPAEVYHRAAAALDGLPAPELDQPATPPRDQKGSDA